MNAFTSVRGNACTAIVPKVWRRSWKRMRPRAGLVQRRDVTNLGQVLIAPDGFRIVDFEGEPLRTLEERRSHNSPLRDVASMLRSLDHVGRSAGRRAEARNGGHLGRPGLDLDGWLLRSRARFLDAYRAGLREAGAPIVVDPDLLRAFEVEKECYEFIYAATYRPSWLWASTEGMRALFE